VRDRGAVEQGRDGRGAGAAVRPGGDAGRGELLEDRVVAELVVLDERASDYLATVAGGRVTPRPLLRKLR